MNFVPIALQVLLDKINLLYHQAAQTPGGLQGLELDLLKKYTRDWYEALLEVERGAGSGEGLPVHRATPSGSSLPAARATPQTGTQPAAAPALGPAVVSPAVPAAAASSAETSSRVPTPAGAGQDSFLYPARPVVSEGPRKEDAPEIRAGWGYAPHPPRAEPDTPASASPAPPAAVVPPAAPAAGASPPPPAPPSAPSAPAVAPSAGPPPPPPAPPSAPAPPAATVPPVELAPPSAPAPPATPESRPAAARPAVALPPNAAPDEPALNDRFARPERELGQTLTARPAEDLRKLIDVNERFLFTRELFGGNSETYGQAIRRLNELPSLEEALAYLDRELAPANGWNPESKVVLHLRDILEQRYR